MNLTRRRAMTRIFHLCQQGLYVPTTRGCPPDPQALPETAPASAADAILEAEDEAPVMEA